MPFIDMKTTWGGTKLEGRFPRLLFEGARCKMPVG